jgi:hypothetical protein
MADKLDIYEPIVAELADFTATSERAGPWR